MSEKVNSVIDQQIKFHRRFFLIRSPKLRRTDRAFVFIETRVQFCQNVISDLVTFTAVIQPLTFEGRFCFNNHTNHSICLSIFFKYSGFAIRVQYSVYYCNRCIYWY